MRQKTPFPFMNAFPLLNRSSTFIFLLAMSVFSVRAGTELASTDFSPPDYTVGALSNAAWTTANIGEETQWIVKEESVSPIAPTSLASGKHPISPLGTQLLWFSANTSNVSDNQVAIYSFAPPTSRLQEPFNLTLDILASPTGGPGQSFTAYLARDDSSSATTAPRFSFTSTSPSSMTLNVWDAGKSITGEIALPKNTWLRFEIAVDASLSKNGTYVITVCSIDDTGKVIDTLYTSNPLEYSLSGGFNSLRFLTNASRSDYWIAGISIGVTESTPQAVLNETVRDMTAMTVVKVLDFR